MFRSYCFQKLLLVLKFSFINKNGDRYHWESILTQIYVFLVLFTIFAFDFEKFISKKWKTMFTTLGEDTVPYCSRIIVINVYVNVFSLKFTQRVTIL